MTIANIAECDLSCVSYAYHIAPSDIEHVKLVIIAFDKIDSLNEIPFLRETMDAMDAEADLTKPCN